MVNCPSAKLISIFIDPRVTLYFVDLLNYFSNISG